MTPEHLAVAQIATYCALVFGFSLLLMFGPGWTTRRFLAARAAAHARQWSALARNALGLAAGTAVLSFLFAHLLIDAWFHGTWLPAAFLAVVVAFCVAHNLPPRKEIA